MKILLVEDNPTVSQDTKSEIENIIGANSVEVARSKESACIAIDSNFYDIIVLDLSLPLTDDSMDADVAHGQAVFGFCQSHAAGTPICFLTGSSTQRFVNQLLNQYSNRQDYWGDDDSISSPMLFPKINLADFLDHLRACYVKIRKLSDIELIAIDPKLQLTASEQRVMKIFTNKLSGKSCRWNELGGGLSDVKVLSLEILNAQDAPMFRTVARLGIHEKIYREAKNFDKIVAALGIGSFPSKLCFLAYGAKRTTGVFYRLANDHKQNFSELLILGRTESLTVCERLREILQPWREGSSRTRKSIAEVRRCLVGDEKSDLIKEKFSLEWIDEIEELTISTRWGGTHGDLHGGNILVTADYQPTLIDFGDVEERPLSLDACSILLSPFFHPETASILQGTISASTLLNSIENLACEKETPLEPFITYMLTWIKEDCSDSERGIYASIMSFTYKQLQYADTDKDLAMAILNICKAKILATI